MQSCQLQYLLPTEPLLQVRMSGVSGRRSSETPPLPRASLQTTSSSWQPRGMCWAGDEEFDHDIIVSVTSPPCPHCSSGDFSSVLEGALDQAFAQLGCSLTEAYHSAAQRYAYTWRLL